MENTELNHILIAYKSTNIGLQQAHDEILRLFNVVEQSEQLPKRLSNEAYKCARTMDYNGFVNWWDKQV